MVALYLYSTHFLNKISSDYIRSLFVSYIYHMCEYLINKKIDMLYFDGNIVNTHQS